MPDAIGYQAERDWPAIRERCHELVVKARTRIANLTDLPPITPAGCSWFVQMATCPIRTKSIQELKTGLYDQYRVEIPCGEWQGMQFVRVSIQAYNTEADIDRLMEGLGRLL